MNQDLHNPAAISLELVGPNHKLLSAEDLDKPLPEGTEWWDADAERWEVSEYAKMERKPATTLTYRIPLKLSDRLRKDVARLVDLILVVEAVENGAEFEIRSDEARHFREWSEPDNSLEWFLSPHRSCKWQVRLKPIPPTPQTIPWTLESHPDVVCVKQKNGRQDHLSITRWGGEYAYIEGYGSILYADLHRDWLQRNGEPAGEKVTV